MFLAQSERAKGPTTLYFTIFFASLQGAKLQKKRLVFYNVFALQTGKPGTKKPGSSQRFRAFGKGAETHGLRAPGKRLGKNLVEIHDFMSSPRAQGQQQLTKPLWSRVPSARRHKNLFFFLGGGGEPTKNATQSNVVWNED